MRRGPAHCQLALFAVATLQLLSCGGADGRSGIDEPLRVHDAQFVSGELPGEPPLPPGSDLPRVPPTTSSGIPSKSELRQGLGSVTFTGQASDDATTVGVRLAEVGTGYWFVPTLYRDVQSANTLIWSFSADFQESLAAGTYTMLTVAFDTDGNAGTQSETPICVNSLVPDNGNACDPTIGPPAFVVSLEWDEAADLDLKLVLPGGEEISAAHPTSGVPDEAGNIDLYAPGVGQLQRDSNGDCGIDGRNREDIVFQAALPPGNYLVYANLNRSCGHGAVSYEASYHHRTRNGEEFGVATRSLGGGTLLSRQAGVRIGTFIGEVTVN